MGVTMSSEATAFCDKIRDKFQENLANYYNEKIGKFSSFDENSLNGDYKFFNVYADKTCSDIHLNDFVAIVSYKEDAKAEDYYKDVDGIIEKIGNAIDRAKKTLKNVQIFKTKRSYFNVLPSFSMNGDKGEKELTIATSIGIVGN